MNTEKKKPKQRTVTQNAALHLFCRLLADTLNSKGLDMKRVLKKTIDIPWTLENVKNHLWKPIQEAQLGKVSTTELETTEVSLVYDTLIRHLAENHGVSENFPSIEEITHKLRTKQFNQK